MTYDSRGRPARVEYLDRDPDIAGSTPVVLWSELTSYDEAGNPVHHERRDTADAVTWVDDREYDVQHRMVSQMHPDQPGKSKSWTFDATGSLAEMLDEDGRKTTSQPEALGRVGSVVRSGLDASGTPASTQVARYTYLRRDLSSVIDEKGLPTTYWHADSGATGEVMSDSFIGGPMQLEYDSSQNVVRRRSYGAIVDNTYDGLGRVLTIVGQDRYDTRRIAYELRYDENGFVGKLTSVIEPTRTVTYAYDAAGRLASESVSEAGLSAPLVTGYGYDAWGRIAQLDYPSGLSITFERDTGGNTVRVRTADGSTVFADEIRHWPGGPVSAFTFGSGEPFELALNHRYEPTALRSGPLNLVFGMTPSGDIGTVQDGAGTATYAYDHVDRLAGGASGMSVAAQYYPSPLGANTDRLKAWGTFTSGNLTTGKLLEYDYQTNTSLVAQKVNGTTTAAVCLRHDPLGRLVLVGTGRASGYGMSCVTDAEVKSTAASFRYDVQGRREARWLASTGEWTYFVHAQSGELLSELRVVNGTWRPVRDYVWLEGRPLAQIEYGSGIARIYYVHADQLGTPRNLTSSERAVVWTAGLQPYGEVAEITTPDPVTGQTVVTNLRLPGQYDERLFAAAGISGLQGPYYNWNRWYLPGVGRYLELDPVALEGGFNSGFGVDWYGYARQNPLSWTDADGLMPSPTGPYHPPPPQKSTPSCKAADTCEMIGNTMTDLQAMIWSHVQWDMNTPEPHGGTRHQLEIQQLVGNYDNCQKLYRSKCTDSTCGPVCKTVTVLVGIGAAVTICVQPEAAPVLLPALAP
jgi:RHS repeat-associated protein